MWHRTSIERVWVLSCVAWFVSFFLVAFLRIESSCFALWFVEHEVDVLAHWWVSQMRVTFCAANGPFVIAESPIHVLGFSCFSRFRLASHITWY